MLKLKTVEIKNRWMVVIAAIVLELALGAIYAWSVYVPAFLTYSSYTSTTLTQIPYSVGLASFAVVVVLPLP